MMQVAGRRNQSRNRMPCMQALKPLGHGDLSDVLFWKENYIDEIP